MEFDIKAAFDEIDHGLLLKAVRTHIKERWVLLYLEWWLTAPFETAEGEQVPRQRGTPQGGVVSPILMNLFMHYAFDLWMARKHPQCRFCRYADDGVVHCRSQEQAREVMRSIASRLAECGLMVHPAMLLPIGGRKQECGQEPAPKFRNGIGKGAATTEQAPEFLASAGFLGKERLLSKSVALDPDE